MNATRPSQECDRETEATNERLSEMTMRVTSNRECLRCYNALWLSLLSPVISDFSQSPSAPRGNARALVLYRKTGTQCEGGENNYR